MSDTIDLSQTIECGQFFQYRKDNGGYWVVSSGRRAFIIQDGDGLRYEGVNDGDTGFWDNLLDLSTDYEEIKGHLTENDPVMREAVRFAPGIHIMNQDPWECMLGFIISQNNRIPMIMKTLRNISQMFGNGFNNDEDYAPPKPDILAALDEAPIRECKAGFRAKYILDAARKAAGGDINLYSLGDVDTGALRTLLMTVNGIGAKVADCVMLFSMGRREVFPIDVWIARVMRRLYFDGREVPLKEIQLFAASRFGPLAGYAQQYLFHYARSKKIV
jgi:N-glycosylase/DNA lyase